MNPFLQKIGLIAVIMLSSLSASAYDIEADGIYYNVVSVSDLTCEVTSGDNKYKGVVTIPSSASYKDRQFKVLGIGEYAFEGCTSLSSIKNPETVTYIGKSAFRGCSSLTSVNIPESVTSIGGSAFAGCTSLTSVNIPEAVTDIGQSAFWGCSSLASVNIPEAVTNIQSSAFEGCTSLTSVNIPEAVTYIGGGAFAGCTSLTSVNIPEAVTYINYRAFAGCTSLTSIKIPEAVTDIIQSAFEGCTSLTSVNIPEAITYIGQSAFKGCSSLASVNIPKSVTSIGKAPFQDCTALTSVTLHTSAIDKSTFTGCSNIQELSIYSAKLPGDCFAKCEAIYKLSFGAQSESININGVFGEWNQSDIFPILKEVYLARKVTSSYGINWTKYNYYTYPSKFEKITFGKDLSEYDFFEDFFIRNLDTLPTTATIYCENPTPPSCGTYFSNKQYMDMTVYVPKDALEAYQNADGWKNFWNMKTYDPDSGIEDVAIDREEEDGILWVYNLQGVLVKKTTDRSEIDNLPSGLYIVNGKKIAIK